MAKYVQGQKQCLTMIMKNAHLVVIKQKLVKFWMTVVVKHNIEIDV